MFSQQNMPFWLKGLVLVGVPLLMSLSILCILYAVLEHREEQQAHTNKIITLINRISLFSPVVIGEMSAYTITFAPAHLKKYEAAVAQLQRDYAELQKEEGGDASRLRELERIQKLHNHLREILEFAKSVAESREAQPLEMLRLGSIYPLAEQLTNDYAERWAAFAESSRKQSGEQTEEQWRLHLKQIVGAAVAINIIVGFVLVCLFSRSILTRLRALMDNAVRVSTEQSLLPQVSGSDEIAALDKVFHQMHAALVRSRQRERAVVDYAVDIICSLDENLSFVAINPAGQELFGIPEQQLVCGSFANFVEPAVAAETLATIVKAKEARMDVSFETTVKSKEGQLVYLLWTVQWSEAEALYCCVGHDITEMKMAQDERKRMEQLKQDFINMVSHDLRSPLSSIQGTLALLSEGAFGQLPEVGKNLVCKTEHEIVRLIGLVNDLLDLEKVRSGKLNLSFELVDIDQLIKTAVSAVQYLCDSKQITTEVRIAQECTRIAADGKRLIQVLINLLSNAIKFSPAAGVITVAVEKTDVDFFVFKVSDQGPGIESEDREAIFDQFYQVQKHATMHGGSGLGLAICKTIVEAHSGTIGVDPGHEGGSVFWFKIPCTSAVFETYLQRC